MHNRFRTAILALCCLSLAACTTLQAVGLKGHATEGAQTQRPGPLASEGDTVLVETASGRRFEARIERIAGTHIELVRSADGGRESLPHSDITALGRSQFSVPRTLLLVAGIAAAAYLVAFVKLLQTLNGSW